MEVRPDALPEIRRRIAARRVWRLRWGGAFLGTGAVATVATVATVMAGTGSCGPQPIQPPVPGQTSAASPSAGPTSAAPTSAAPASGSPTAAPPGATANVPVYYVRVDRGQPRLYREWHTVSVGDASASAKARAAVAEMLAGRPYDPDYASSWPAGVGVRDVRISGGTVTVDLTGASSAALARPAAVQQLVWTATAADAGLDTVRLLVDGRPAAAPLSGDLHRAPAVDVLGLVWIIDPQHGATVGRTFAVRVAGIVHEATMYLRVRQGTAIVSDRFVTLDNGPPAQGTATVTLSLAPGVYMLDGYAISMEDGSESTSTTTRSPCDEAALAEWSPVKTFDELFAELQAKAAARTPGSGTVAALERGVHAVGKKVVEEAAEAWMAAEHEGPERAAEEIAQLLYRAQVLMLASGLNLKDVYRHL